MVTGYTADLHAGKPVTFEEFALRCARATGALVEMRDESPDTKIPEGFVPDSYHLEEAEAAKKRLAKIEKWSDEFCEREARKAHKEEIKSAKRSAESDIRSGKNYTRMLAEIAKWIPPTKDHEGLKEFMIEQLASSLDFDCFMGSPTFPQCFTGKQYRASLIRVERRNIRYHTGEYREEVARARDNSEWIQKLRESLKK